jgi:hypothetical protein
LHISYFFTADDDVGQHQRVLPEVNIPNTGEEYFESDDEEINYLLSNDSDDNEFFPLPDLDDAGEMSDDESNKREPAISQPKSAKPPPAKKRKMLKDNLSSGTEDSDLKSTDDETEKRASAVQKKKQQQLKSDSNVSSSSSPKRSSVHQYLYKKGNSFCPECYQGNTVPHLEFEISTDGVQLHARSGKTAAWPIMASLLSISPCFHLKDKIRFYLPKSVKPVIVGFFYGTAKPCANDLFRCMFKDIKLAERRRLCTMELRFVIADGPGRQLAKGFPSSNAYCGCERCIEEGIKLNKTVPDADQSDESKDEDADDEGAQETQQQKKKKKPKKKKKKKGKNTQQQTTKSGHVAIALTRDLRLRTQKNYLNKKFYFNIFPDPKNVFYKYSLLESNKFDIIHSVPLDSMHTVFHCALSWLVHATWIKGKKVKGGKFSAKLMASIEKNLSNVKGNLPYAIEASIGTKPFAKFNITWSTSEKRIFLLYVAIIVLNDDLMDPDAYQILLSFQHAVMLLVGSRHCSEVPEDYRRKAKQHLLYVVEKCQQKYGADFPRYTFHCLLHIVDDLAHNKCRLDYCSMFRYENGMRFFANVLNARGGARVQAQIRNALIRKSQSQIVLPPL